LGPKLRQWVDDRRVTVALTIPMAAGIWRLGQGQLVRCTLLFTLATELQTAWSLVLRLRGAAAEEIVKLPRPPPPNLDVQQGLPASSVEALELRWGPGGAKLVLSNPRVMVRVLGIQVRVHPLWAEPRVSVQPLDAGAGGYGFQTDKPGVLALRGRTAASRTAQTAAAFCSLLLAMTMVAVVGAARRAATRNRAAGNPPGAR